MEDLRIHEIAASSTAGPQYRNILFPQATTGLTTSDAFVKTGCPSTTAKRRVISRCFAEQSPSTQDKVPASRTAHCHANPFPTSVLLAPACSALASASR